MRKHRSKRLTALVLALVLCLSLVVPVGAVGTSGGTNVRFEQVDNSVVSATLRSNRVQREQAETPLYQDTDMVRVSIVLSGKSTIEKGFATMDIAENSQAMAYRDQLQAQQETVASRISKQVLGGKKLDVVWNLTLAANIISANVPYGDIEAIKAVSGVANVVLETRYEPAVVGTDPTDPNMATSSSMIGSSAAWAEGYTGAGSRIAIIDTGTDTDHQSFDAKAFEYAIAEDAKDAGKEVPAYNLLTAAEIADKLPLLNAYQQDKTLTADALYGDAKLAFGYNYVDGDLDITHDNDTQGEHGSHVAGIATANRYIATGEDTYGPALEVAHTQGVAPDAQLLTMKVFGKSGGAYDSDYMAAIEDAIVLGCDSINLSLGSAAAGMVFSEDYQEILDELENTDTVVCISAGNAGSWADETFYGYLYSDGVNLDTVGSPGSYANALTVASVDNVGQTGNYLTFGDKAVFFSETSGGSNAPIATMDKSEDGSGTEYKFVLFENTGVDGDGNSLLTDYADDIEGKVVMVYRGTSSFYQKHDAVAAAGGVACIVVNNQAGTINMDLSDSKATIPCVSITLADGKAITAAATAVTNDSDEVLYYTGTVTVSGQVGSATGDSEYYTMSSFSSWGVPGDLSLKPEITAPGGNIYSVNGAVAGGEAYENMSGTSMAAPQVTGMVAVLAQYLRESGLAEKTGVSARHLAQSLLMSTAEPMTDEYGDYYPVIQQGAGLANVNSAINANSYVMVDGQSDGKAKVELGDDPAKNGVYTATFTIHNFTDEAQSYALSADVFTQDVFDNTFSDGSVESFLAGWTVELTDADVSWSSDAVTVPANGSCEVTATIDVSGCDLTAYPVGAYIEAYLYAEEVTEDDGTVGTVHSIPVLGFYGNWSDASMFDVGSYIEYAYGAEDRAPYLYPALGQNSLYANSLIVNYAGDNGDYYFGGNPYVEDDAYLPQRNALNNQRGDVIASQEFAPIRNIGASKVTVTDIDTDAVYLDQSTGACLAAYYSDTNSRWGNTGLSAPINWTGTDANGDPLPEDTKVMVTFTAAPEYYAEPDGSYRWDELGEGTTLSMPLTIDNTAPQVLNAAHTAAVAADEENGVQAEPEKLVLQVKDNQYIAAALLIDNTAQKVVEKKALNQETPDTAADVAFAFSDELQGHDLYVVVVDYADNQRTYKLTVGEIDDTLVTPTDISLSPAALTLVKGTKSTISASFEPWMADENVTWKSSDDSVVSVDENGTVTAVGEGTATITAVSVVNPRVSGSCTVNVIIVDYTLSGALQDTNGNAQLFTWNLLEESWKKSADLDPKSIVSATLDSQNDVLYVMDAENYNLYPVDPDTGKSLTAAPYAGGGVPFWDMEYSKVFSTENAPSLNAIYGYYLLIDEDPAALDTSAYNLGSYLADYGNGASCFTALTSMGATTYTYEDEETGEEIADENTELLYALDDNGNLWAFYVCQIEGECQLMDFEVYPTALSDMGLKFPGHEGDMYCSLVAADDGVLFLSYFNGSTNEIYLLTVNEAADGIESVDAILVGNVGQGVWPCALYSAEKNAVVVPVGPSKPSKPSTPAEPAAPELPFTDVTTDHPFYEDIKYVYEKGLMQGVSEDIFQSATTTTRGMIATILYRMEGEPAVKNASSFKDVADGMFYSNAVAWAAANGIVNGYADGIFQPDQTISREQMAAILYRYAQYKGCDVSVGEDTNILSYTDATQVAEYAIPAVQWAVGAGIINGTTASTLSPKGSATRGQVAAILHRYCEWIG